MPKKARRGGDPEARECSQRGGITQQVQNRPKFSSKKVPNLVYYGPQQDEFEGERNMPVVGHEIRDGSKAYRKMMKKRRKRAGRIASALIGPYKIPVTPLPNPVTGVSYHIVRLTDRRKPRYRVDLLVRDTDLYIVAFRRQRQDHTDKWFGKTWYRYSDVKDLPKEIEVHAKPLHFKSSHSFGAKTSPGGINVLVDIFETLSTFEDCARDESGKLLDGHDGDRVETAMLRCIIIYSEALRFRSIYLAIFCRIRDTSDSSELHESLWVLIKHWGAGSRSLLMLWKQESLLMHNDTPSEFKNVQVVRPGLGLIELNTIGDLIGSSGEILVIRLADHLVLDPEALDIVRGEDEKKKELKKVAARVIPEPGFEYKE